MLNIIDDIEVFNCLLLLFLAVGAATVALQKARYDDANPSWKHLWRIFWPYRRFEGFWRILYVHLSFAGVALTATAPAHLRNQTWGHSITVLLILGNVSVAYFSQLRLNEETTTAMTDDDRKKATQIGVLVLFVYALSALFVIYGVATKPLHSQ